MSEADGQHRGAGFPGAFDCCNARIHERQRRHAQPDQRHRVEFEERRVHRPQVRALEALLHHQPDADEQDQIGAIESEGPKFPLNIAAEPGQHPCGHEETKQQDVQDRPAAHLLAGQGRVEDNEMAEHDHHHAYGDDAKCRCADAGKFTEAERRPAAGWPAGARTAWSRRVRGAKRAAA